MQKGDRFRFTKGLGPLNFEARLFAVDKGDVGEYLGDSQAVILTGPSKDWLVTLLVDAPVEKID